MKVYVVYCSYLRPGYEVPRPMDVFTDREVARKFCEAFSSSMEIEEYEVDANAVECQEGKRPYEVYLDKAGTAIEAMCQKPNQQHRLRFGVYRENDFESGGVIAFAWAGMAGSIDEAIAVTKALFFSERKAG